MPRVTVSIDHDLCIAAGSCVNIAPAVFRIGDENRAVVLKDGTAARTQTLDVSDEQLEAIRDAAQSCPTGAIYVQPE